MQWMRDDQEGVGRDDDPGRGRRARRGEQDRRAMPTAGERGGDARDQPARDRPDPSPSSITAQAAAAAGTSRRSTGGCSVGARIRP